MSATEKKDNSMWLLGLGFVVVVLLLMGINSCSARQYGDGPQTCVGTHGFEEPC